MPPRAPRPPRPAAAKAPHAAPRGPATALALALAAAPLLAGCGGDFDPPSSLTSLRVLAVKVTPPYAKPGQPVSLEMLYYDGSPRSRRPDGTPRQVQLLWVGGCHNPPSDQYAGCFPIIGQALSGLTPEAIASGEASEFIGLGPTWGFTVPADITDRPPPGDDTVPYGLSYVFFAACGGLLELDETQQGNLPLRCVDPDTGALLGPDDFVSGYTPIYSYDALVNTHPALLGLRFQGAPEASPPISCVASPDCGEGLGCSPDGRCLPSVPPCTEDALDDCPEYKLVADVDPASAEVDEASQVSGEPTSQESIWATYFSTDGRFTRQAALVNDPQQGWVDDQETEWRAPNAPAGVVRFWAVVRDNRGGTAWQTLDILVELERPRGRPLAGAGEAL